MGADIHCAVRPGPRASGPRPERRGARTGIPCRRILGGWMNVATKQRIEVYPKAMAGAVVAKSLCSASLSARWTIDIGLLFLFLKQLENALSFRFIGQGLE